MRKDGKNERENNNNDNKQNKIIYFVIGIVCVLFTFYREEFFFEIIITIRAFSCF